MYIPAKKVTTKQNKLDISIRLSPWRVNICQFNTI